MRNIRKNNFEMYKFINFENIANTQIYIRI